MKVCELKKILENVEDEYDIVVGLEMRNKKKNTVTGLIQKMMIHG